MDLAFPLDLESDQKQGPRVSGMLVLVLRGKDTCPPGVGRDASIDSGVSQIQQGEVTSVAVAAEQGGQGCD